MKRKTSKITLAFSIFFVFAMFAGCGGLLSPVVTDEPTAGGTGGGVAAGKVLVVANLESAESSSRAAVPSAMSSIENFSYFGALKTSESDTSAVYEKGTLSEGKLTFEFDLPSATTGLILEIVAYTNTTLTEKPATTASLSATKSGLAIENNTITISEKLALKPTTSSGTGSVNLSISLPSENYSLTYTCSDTDFPANAATQTGTAVTISASGVAANSYTLVFLVKNSSGNIVYGWTETIVVYAGMTTDAWLLEGATSTEAKEITEDTITAAEQKIFYVRGSDFSDGTKSWYTANLSSATASDENLGTLMQPLLTVQTAIDKVKAVNDGSSEYMIYVDGEFTAESGANVAKIQNTSGPHLTLSILGLGSTKAVFKGNGTSVMLVRSGYQNYLDLSLQNIKITGGGSDSSYGGGINAGEDNDNANSGGTITLTDCEISGNRAKTGGGISYFSNQAGDANLTLNNCVVTKNTAWYGGGIYAWRGTVVLDNGTVIGDASSTLNSVVGESNCGQTGTGVGGNLATIKGGGICLGQTNKGLVVKAGCYVSANYCSGTSDRTSGGGGIYIESGVEFTSDDKAKIESGAYVQYNYAADTTSGNGGGIYADTKPITIEGNIIGNKAAVSGGGVYSSGTLTLNSGAKIQDNAAATNGGGICTENGNLTITGTSTNKAVISGNTAMHGAGLYIYEKDGTTVNATITDCIISGNTATKTLSPSEENPTDGGKGGGIYIGGNDYTGKGDGTLGVNPDVTITDSEIKSNSTNFYGGGIINFGKLTLKGCSIGGEGDGEGNSAGINGGAIYSNGNITIDANSENKKTAIVNNSADNNGGGIVNSSLGILTLIGSEFYANLADQLGGAVYNQGELEINDGTQIGAAAKANAALSLSGGGIVNTATGKLTLKGGAITGNTAKKSGAGIYNEGTLNIEGGKIASNSAEEHGGGIAIADGGTLIMSGGTIGGTDDADANTSTYNGAGIFTEGNLTITGGSISHNKANGVGYGGGIYISTGTTTISGGTISENSAYKGTGICFDSGTLNLEDDAKIGGELYLSKNTINIAVTSSLKNGVVATITPYSYTEGTQVLSAGDGIDLAGEVSKFDVTSQSDGTEWVVGKDGNLKKVISTTDAITALTSATSGSSVDIAVSVSGQSDFDKIKQKISASSASSISIVLKSDNADSDFTEISSSVFQGNTKLVSVTLPDCIKKINSSAFKQCSKLEHIVLPSDLEEIGENAFASCSALTSVIIPDKVTKIGGTAFNYCSALQTVIICGNITEIGAMAFASCTNLQSLTFTSEVPPETVGTYVFLNCSSLKILVPQGSAAAYSEKFSDYSSQIEEY